MYYIGIDVGGTTVKGMIVDEKGKSPASGFVPTVSETLAEDIAGLTKKLMRDAKVEKAEGVGIGCPGIIDSEHGEVVFAANLGLTRFPLAGKVQAILNMPVKITNDANAAALGEAKFGSGKNYKDCILVTLGTGVGGGIIIDGKLFEGYKSAGAEIGHTVIEFGGEKCTCGRCGCFEAYASATALIKSTKRAMSENKDSLMWEIGSLENVSGKTAFDYAGKDQTARGVVDRFIKYLGCGLVNLANTFRPEIIMIGGGVSKQGDNLIVPLQKFMDTELFGAKENYAPVKIASATLGSDAGAYGAAALIM